MVRTGRFPVIGDGRQRRSMVYVDNLVAGRRRRRADCRRRPGGRGGSPTPGRTRWPRSSRRSAGRCAPRASTSRPTACRSRRSPVPAGRAGRRADPADRAVRAAAPRARRDGQDDRLRHLRRPGRARLPTRGRARGGHAAQHPLVPRAGPRAVTTSLVTGGNGYFGQLLVQRLAGRGRRRAGARHRRHRCRRPRRRGRRRRHPRPRRRPARPSTASTSCSTTSPRCRSPRTPTCCARSTSTAPRSCSTPAGDAGVAQGRAHVVERRVRDPRDQPGAARPRCPSRRRPYGHAKLAAEWACLRAVAAGLDVTIVRPRTILGHGRLGIFGILFDWIADGADPFVLGDGSNRYQFVHADDLADACMLAARARRARRCSTSAPTASARCARRSSTCARTPAPAPRCARCPAGPTAAAMRASAALAPHAVRALPLADVRAARCGSTSTTSATRSAGRPRWSTDEMFAESYDWFVANRATPALGSSPTGARAQAGALAAAQTPDRAPARARQSARRAAERVIAAEHAVRFAAGVLAAAGLRPGAAVVARTDAGGHQAVPLPRPRTG